MIVLFGSDVYICENDSSTVSEFYVCGYCRILISSFSENRFGVCSVFSYSCDRLTFRFDVSALDFSFHCICVHATPEL